MERITGRVAITVMAELDLGLRKLSDDEMAYVWRQAASFRDWLIQNHKMSLDEAKEICRNLYEKDIELLQQVDPYADFIWSRGQEVGQAEIDLASMADMDFEGNSDAEHRAHQQYWDHMERTAETHAGRLSAEQWKYSTDKFNEITEYIDGLGKKINDRLLGNKEQAINRAANRLNQLRFGKVPVLTYRHWALAQNMLTTLRGKGKIMKVAEAKEKQEDSEYQDAMDMAIVSLDQELLYGENDEE